MVPISVISSTTMNVQMFVVSIYSKNWIGTGTFFTPLMIKGNMTHEYITEGQNVCQQETSFQEYVYVRVRNSSTEHLIKKGSFQI